ncbi:hypothetical protein O1157_00105 [Streptomyces albogriseolus]
MPSSRSALELVGAGLDPGGFAQFGPDGVGLRVVDGARGGVSEQLREALPLRELRLAADVVGQVLVPERLPGVEPRFFEGRRGCRA